MKEGLYLLGIVILAGLLWVRLSPHDADRWHVDPADADPPRGNGYRIIGEEAPRFLGDPQLVIETLIDVARTEDRARILDGGVDEGMITFVTRTKWVGFPDYVTFKAVAEGDRTKLAAISRARYGGSDWGVNRERLDRWFAELERRLGA